jgi:hypothetical protein
MTTPRIGALPFTTMTPDIRTADPVYIDQHSTGRNGTDSVLAAWRARPQVLTVAREYADYAAALAAREALRRYANTLQDVTDASGQSYAHTRIRMVHPNATAQADGTGLLVADITVLIASVDPGTPT